MKKTFFIAFSLILLSSGIVLAQTHTKTMSSSHTKDMLSFGGNLNGSTVSIMQLIDYPVLLLSDKEEIVLNYEIKVTTEENQSEKALKISGAKLASDAIDYLRELAGEKGKIVIQNVTTQKGTVTFETPYSIELNFNQ
ncbi:MAG: hypothetical protein WC716_00155 [Chitinophagaceae bacterium]|jgi:hypothetical protein